MTDEKRYPYVHVDVSAQDIELRSVTLWELGALGVEERDGGTFERGSVGGKTTLVASFESEEVAALAIEFLNRVEKAEAARLEWVEGDGWRAGWRAYFTV